jgi:hypothetical protein
MLINYIRNRVIVAGVAAELKAQCHDQNIVKAICFSEFGMGQILELSEGRFRKKNKMRYFMITSFLLAETLRTFGFSLELKSICFELMSYRTQKITQYLALKGGDQDISFNDVQDFEEISDLGISVFHAERRSASMSSLLEE